MVGRPDPAPVHIELDECGLHEVIRALPVIAQHRGQPSQRRQPGCDVLRVLGVPAAPHQRPPYALTYSTIARGAQRRIRLSRPSGIYTCGELYLEADSGRGLLAGTTLSAEPEASGLDGRPDDDFADAPVYAAIRWLRTWCSMRIDDTPNL